MMAICDNNQQHNQVLNLLLEREWELRLKTENSGKRRQP